MQPEKLFDLIANSEYIKSGIDVDWLILVDDNEKIIRLLFQESTTKMDWKTNLNFPVKVYKEQKSIFLVHKGYAKAWKSVNDLIINELIKTFKNKPMYQIQICGWSFGGAMSLFAAEDFYFRTGRKIDCVITFGAPKPLFGFFTKNHFKKSSDCFLQYTLSYDSVTWCIPLPGYKRIKTKIVDKKNCWKIWRVFNTEKYHCSYGNEEYYK